MSRSVAYIKVTCDKCKVNTVEVCLKDTGACWSDRLLSADLRIYNWHTREIRGKDVCAECRDKEYNETERIG